MNLMQEIVFTAGQHNNKNVIWCKFPKNDLVLSALKKQFPFCRWSNTNKCWYITDSVEIRKKLIFLKQNLQKI